MWIAMVGLAAGCVVAAIIATWRASGKTWDERKRSALDDVNAE
jgi:hypothetical protein